MNISITKFLELLSHNGIINPVTLPSDVAAEIALELQQIEAHDWPCYVEPINEFTTDVWFPCITWYVELRRRERVLRGDSSVKNIKDFKATLTKEQLKKQLVDACLAGDFTAMAALTEQINKI